MKSPVKTLARRAAELRILSRVESARVTPQGCIEVKLTDGVVEHLQTLAEFDEFMSRVAPRAHIIDYSKLGDT